MVGVVALVCLALFTACEKEMPVGAEATGQQHPAQRIETLKGFLAEVAGVEVSKVRYEVEGERFFVDGDQVMRLEDAEGHYANAQKQLVTGHGKTTQRSYTYLVNAGSAPYITLYVNPAVPVDWSTAINQAIFNWNVTDCRIKVTRVYSPGASIYVGSYYEVSNTIAYAYLPSWNGNVGHEIQINTYHNGLSASQKQFAITHEMGHNFGFTHTNEGSYNLIPGTPVSDPNSVMNSTVLNWNGFTPYDVIAWGVVYPNVAGTVRLLRYNKTTGPDHHYTTSPAELGAGGGGYVFERGEGYVYLYQAGGTMPIYRYYHPSLGVHFMTINYAELGGGAHGYVYEGVIGYAYGSQVAGSRPLYRYYRPSVGDRLYTIYYNELGQGAYGFVLEGVGFYVM